ncbi:MAG TPA: peptidoglycan bridge formation protein FemAB, partial [Sphingobacterium sp.]|nr:peptidoglycan bridge formation protein FemAB [Sphingobacterium sp.]
MIADISDKEISGLYKTGIIQQTAYWSAVKKMQGIQSKAFNFKSKQSDLYVGVDDDTYFIGDLLIIIQAIDQEHSIAYVPYGPEIEHSDENQGYFLEQRSESLRSHLPPN